MDIVPMQGVSFLPALQGKNVERKAPLFWEWAKGKAMRDKQWKMVKHGQDSTWNLYDIIQDPTEINDVAEQHPDVVAHMDSLYNEWLQKVYQ
jgi:arylsulfatase